MNPIISDLRQALKSHGDDQVRQSSKHFLKETIKCYGVKTPLVTTIAKEHFKSLKAQPKRVIFDLCDILWQSGFIEESFIACHWSYFVRKEYEPDDFKTFERWVDSYVTNWASCDTLCNHTVGEFLIAYPEYLQKLKKWASSKNRWMRRASAVSLIIPAKKGFFLKDILEIADILLLDTDDLVQKGYGWMLKAASQSNVQPVFDYVMKKKAIMPRTALRYAIEKMPKELKAKAMER
jgi:3-methyladenine DNA glycosylase AlkD